jgi:hypothetical protein
VLRLFALRRTALFINALTGAVVWRGQKEFLMLLAINKYVVINKKEYSGISATVA